MRLTPVPADLPEGYELVRGRRGWLVAERTALPALRAAGFGPEGGERLSQSDLSGRGPLGSIEADGERWIVRRYRHGGLLRFLGESSFPTPLRPLRELVLAERLRAAGFLTPRVVAARALRDHLGWRLALVSVRVEGAVDGAEMLERVRAGELGFSGRRHFLGSTGRLIGRLHAAGFLHADLTPRNLLFVPGTAAEGVERGEPWVLDLDGGHFGEALAPRRQRGNLRRLYRSVRRREARARDFLGRGDYMCFLRGYEAGRGVPERAQPRWREDWRTIVSEDRRSAPLHLLGWWLETRLGGGPETRDGAAVPR